MQSKSPAELFDVKETRIPLPEGARLFRSVKCAECGEVCAESFTHSVDGKPLCRDCYKPYTRFDV